MSKMDFVIILHSLTLMFGGKNEFSVCSVKLKFELLITHDAQRYEYLSLKSHTCDLDLLTIVLFSTQCLLTPKRASAVAPDCKPQAMATT